MGGSFFFARRGRGIRGAEIRGDTGMRRGTLERVPRTPQNFPERIIAAVTQRSCPVLRASPPIEHYLPAHFQCRTGTAAGVPGAKPPAELTYSLPLPAGKGVGGIGAEKQAKGRQTGNQPVKPPPGIPPPPVASAPLEQAPRRTPPPRPPPVPHRHSRRGAGGEAPGKTNLWSPPSPEGKGVGGIGAERTVKVGQTGNHPVKPPPGCHYLPPASSAAQAQPQGCRGRSPRQN